jgi:flagellar export protein FliJ
MAAPTSLKRLAAIRRAEEQHSRTRMEMAIAELHRLEQAFDGARNRAKQGRRSIVSAVNSGASEDRIAGMTEIAAADRVTVLLAEIIHSAERQVSELRDAFVAKRIERRQAESLLESQTAQETLERSRKSQTALDDWHRSRSGDRKTGRSLKEGSSKPIGLALSPDRQET